MSYAVIIPSYNRPDMLKRALASVYVQTVLPSQICLTIDEPEDGEKYAFLADYDDALQVTYSGGGFGGAKARNVGLDQVGDVDYVFFLDDDDEWLPEKIEKQVDLLERRPDAMGVTCDCYRCIGDSRSVVSRDEQKINRYVKLWNFTGGFSCFGVRWKGILREMRLRDELASAQDFEYYIRVAQAGVITSVHDALILFYAHDGVRISGNRLKKKESYEQILKMNREILGFEDVMFNRAKMDLMTAPFLSSIWGGFFAYLTGTLRLIAAFCLPSISWHLWISSTRHFISRFRGTLKLETH